MSNIDELLAYYKYYYKCEHTKLNNLQERYKEHLDNFIKDLSSLKKEIVETEKAYTLIERASGYNKLYSQENNGILDNFDKIRNNCREYLNKIEFTIVESKSIKAHSSQPSVSAKPLSALNPPENMEKPSSQPMTFLEREKIRRQNKKRTSSTPARLV